MKKIKRFILNWYWGSYPQPYITKISFEGRITPELTFSKMSFSDWLLYKNSQRKHRLFRHRWHKWVYLKPSHLKEFGIFECKHCHKWCYMGKD